MWAFSSCGGRDSLVVELRGSRRVGSVVAALSLSSCGTQAQLLCGMWNLSRLGIKPESPAFQADSLPSEPPGDITKEIKQNKNIQLIQKEGRRNRKKKKREGLDKKQMDQLPLRQALEVKFKLPCFQKFPGSPVVRTWHCHCWWPRFSPWSEN